MKKQSAQRAATYSLILSLVFYSLAPAFSMPVFASEQNTDNNQAVSVDSKILTKDLVPVPIALTPPLIEPELEITPVEVGPDDVAQITPDEAIKLRENTEDQSQRDGEDPEPYIQKDEIKTLTDKLNIQTDTNTGAFIYSYPIEIPQGRNNFQPDLSLTYNNQDTNNQNLFGYGWSLNIPSIERLNKTGVDNLYSENYFSSSLTGELSSVELVDETHGLYASRVENGDFLKYEYSTSTAWQVTDKQGTVYTFGATAASRQDNPSDSTKVFKWLLTEVRDTNDNFIRYEYYKDNGQIYPDKIYYTGHGETDGIFEIEFVREERSDNLQSFQTGFAVLNLYRISQVLIKINDNWIKKYYLNYTTGDNGNRSLLSGIQEAAPAEDLQVEMAMPEEEFDYENHGSGWVENPSWEIPTEFIRHVNYVRDMGVRLVDVNGDGLLDMIQSVNDSGSNGWVQHVWINDGTTWVEDPSWEIPTYFMYETSDKGVRLADVNGDGLVDIIQSIIDGSNGWVQHVWINDGTFEFLGDISDGEKNIDIHYQPSAQYTEPTPEVTMSSANRDAEVLMPETEFDYTDKTIGWSEDVNWNLPQFSGIDMRVISVADLNGDNLPDVFYHIDSSPENIQKTFLNNGDGTWTDDPNCLPPIPARIYEHGYLTLDVNGDGLNDISTQSGLFINNGDCTWVANNWMAPPLGFPTDVSYGTSEYLYIDINGDSWLDTIFTDPVHDWRYIYINHGTNGWQLDDEHVFPFQMGSDYRFLADFNQDGLDDLVDPNSGTYINGGNFDFNQVLGYGMPTYSAKGVRFTDVNGDGLNDVIKSINVRYGCGNTYCWELEDEVHINQGNGSFNLDSNYEVPIYFASQVDLAAPTVDLTGVFIIDINADGFSDLVNFGGEDQKIYLNNLGNQEDVVSRIISDTGTELDLDYVSASSFRDIGDELSNPKLPYIIQTVNQINIFDGLATTTIDYHYSGGEQYYDSENPRDKKFAGFSEVSKTVGDQTSKTYYHQGNESNVLLGEHQDNYYKIGKPYRLEIYDEDENDGLQKQSLYDWQDALLSGDQHFVYQRSKSDSLNNDNLSVDNFDGFSSDSNTIALWHMDGDAGSNDKKDNNQDNSYFDLVEHNTPENILGFDSQNQLGAYQFNGLDQYLSFNPYNPGYGNFTIEGWVKQSEAVGGHIFREGENTSTGRPNLKFTVGSDGFLHCNAAESGSSGTNDQDVYSNSGITLDVWSYVACSRENGVYKIYIDGQLDATVTYASNNNVSGITNTAYFGRSYNSSYPNYDYYFHGAIDEWRISNIARSAIDIGDSYQSYLDYLDTIGNNQSVAWKFNYATSTGNLISEENLGKVSLNPNTGEILDTLVGDEKTTTYDYAENVTKHILSAPKQKVISDIQNSKSQELYYDDLPLGQVNKVNLTKEDYLVDDVEVKRQFNNYGLVEAEIDPKNATTTISYDAVHLYPEIMTNALNQVTYLEYNLLNGQVATSTDPNGLQTVNSYDAFGRLIETKITNPDNLSQLITKQEIVYEDYDFPRYKELKDYFDLNQYKIQREYYDGLDRVIQKKMQSATSTQWSTVDISYDVQGRVERQSLPYYTASVDYSVPDAQQSAKTYTYDALNRVLTESTATGTTTYSYDGFTTTIYDANNHRKDLTRDAYGNLVQVKEYNDQEIYTTDYEYSLTNKLTKITDAQDNERNFVYDDLDNLVSQDMIHDSSVQDPSEMTYTYDQNGNVLSKTNFNGQTIVYTYDALNRVLTEKINGSPKTTYTYDQGTNSIGRLTNVYHNYNGNNQAYDYDILGRTIEYSPTINSENYTISYDYNLNGDLSQIVYPDAKELTYLFNDVGQIASVQVATSTVADNLAYNQNGQLVHLERGNGVITDYTYDPAESFRLTNLITTYATTTLQNLDYVYDDVGNILSITDSSDTDLAKTAFYAYDDLNRLASTTVSFVNLPALNYSQQFSYDAIGNMLTNSDLGTYAYQYDNPHQLSSIGTQDFSYDAAGNLTNDETKTLTWDWESRMTKSQNTGSTDFTLYEYDSNNQRLMKQTKRPETGVIGFNDQKNASINSGSINTEKAGGGNPPPVVYLTLSEEHYIDQYFQKDDKHGDSKDHIFVNGQKIATINNNDDPYYILGDHLGSSSILLDHNGVIAENTDYKPFGSEVYNDTVTDLDDDYTFTGKEKDSENGLQYFGARYMDNEVGRFISIDDVTLNLHDSEELKKLSNQELQNILSNPQILNNYSYSANNPVIYTDPNGNFLDTFLDVGFVTYDSGNTLYKGGQFISSLFSGSLQKASNASEAFLGSFVDLGVDTGAALIPFVPAGLTKVDDAAKLANKAKNFDAVAQQSKMLKGIENSKAINTLKSVFKTSDTIPGGTMGALRNEINTGLKTKDIFHVKKAENVINNIKNVFKTENLNKVESSRLQGISNSLKSLMKNVKF